MEYLWIIIVVAVVVIILLWLVASYNGFVKLRNTVKEAFSTMDVYLKKRWDLIPNLVETVKGYAAHEKETLEGVTALRNSAYDKMTPDEKIATNQELSGVLSRLLMLSENYPDLKANQNFMELSGQLQKLRKTLQIPENIIMRWLKKLNTKYKCFQVILLPEFSIFMKKKCRSVGRIERENVKVEF